MGFVPPTVGVLREWQAREGAGFRCCPAAGRRRILGHEGMFCGLAADHGRGFIVWCFVKARSMYW
jgi:hypothetical protein